MLLSLNLRDQIALNSVRSIVDRVSHQAFAKYLNSG